MIRLIRRLGVAAAAVALGAAYTGSASAMPIFAKAYGIKCSVCHTIVPGLNAYGRYV
ncbi:MAG: hypothetical protein ABI282_06490 [Candidatus Baltobacteraceae bacterium]